MNKTRLFGVGAHGPVFEMAAGRYQEGWRRELSMTLQLPRVEPSWCQTAAEKRQSILTSRKQPRYAIIKKQLTFKGSISFPFPPSLLHLSMRGWHLFCPDPKGERWGREGLASSGPYWDCKGFLGGPVRSLGPGVGVLHPEDEKAN